MSRIGQKYSRIRIHGENRTKAFENQNSWRESNRSIRELEFMVRIGQNYSSIRIHGENRTEVFENQNSWRESNRSIQELEFMVRIGQKYSRIRIHGENRTKVFENQNSWRESNKSIRDPLKMAETRIHSSMVQERLESLLSMSIERNVLLKGIYQVVRRAFLPNYQKHQKQ